MSLHEIKLTLDLDDDAYGEPQRPEAWDWVTLLDLAPSESVTVWPASET